MGTYLDCWLFMMLHCSVQISLAEAFNRVLHCEPAYRLHSTKSVNPFYFLHRMKIREIKFGLSLILKTFSQIHIRSFFCRTAPAMVLSCVLRPLQFVDQSIRSEEFSVSSENNLCCQGSQSMATLCLFFFLTFKLIKLSGQLKPKIKSCMRQSCAGMNHLHKKWSNY